MRRFALPLLSILALALLVACGGSSSTTNVPAPPSGGNNAGYSNASLNGTFVFSASGASSNSFATVGSFTTDGAGNVTAGERDTVDDAGHQTLGESVTGTYAINQDGRGQVVLNGRSGQVIYRFVMTSTGGAKLFQVSNNADAVGRIIQRPSAIALGNLTAGNTFITRLDGENTNKDPYGAIGALTISASGVTGVLDENNAGTFTAQMSTTGSITAPDANGRTTLALTTANGTHNLIQYWTSPTHFEQISTDTHNFAYGYGDRQVAISGSTAAFAGDQVLNIGGYTNNGAIVETGRMTLDGAGNLTNAIEDYNEAGYYFDSVSFGGTYSMTANGRWTASLTYTSSSMPLVGWQVTPSQSIVMTTGTSVLETGTLNAQTTGLTQASFQGNFAEDLSGYFVGNGNVELTGNFYADGAGNLNGTFDSQTPSSENTDLAQTGSYSMSANGRSLATVGGLVMRIYAVDSNTIYMISTDSARIYQGKLEKQL